MSQALYREYRPHLWEQVFGQEHIIHTLQNAVRGNRIGHAYLFAGPRGTGKTTTARLLAKAVNCLDEDLSKRPCDHCAHCKAVNENRFLDLIEIDAASNTSVDDVRDLREKISFSPGQGQYKVYIIDEVHMLSTAAFNALLKTLEEPPPHAIFILATTEVHKIPATVLSRCQRHEFRRIPVLNIVQQLKKIVEDKHLQIEEEVLTLIARQATGSMRDAISLLDQLASSGEMVTLSIAQAVLGTATSQAVVNLVEFMSQRQPANAVNCLHQALDTGSDPRQFARQVVEYLRSLMLIRLGNADQIDALPELRPQMAQQAEVFEMARLMEAIRLFNSAASEGRSGWQPSLLLELALAQIIEEKDVPPVPQVRSEYTSAQPDFPVFNPPKPIQPRSEQVNQPVQNPDWKISSSTAIPPNMEPQPSIGASGQQSIPAKTETSAGQNPDAATDSSSVMQRVSQNWLRVRAVVKKKHPATEALLNSCRPLAIKDGVLILGFATEIVKSKMENLENIEITRQAIASVAGIELMIRCVVGNKGAANSTDLDVDRDGMVGTALNLGGKIVHKE